MKHLLNDFLFLFVSGTSAAQNKTNVAPVYLEGGIKAWKEAGKHL